MIKIPTRFSSEFIEEYFNIVSDIVFTNKIVNYEKKIEEDGEPEKSDEYNNFTLYLSKNFHKIIYSEFNELLNIQIEIDQQFPIISECYNPKAFFKEQLLNEINSIAAITEIPLRGTRNTAEIISQKDSALNEAIALNIHLRSYFLEKYINELSNANDSESIKQSCKKISNLFKKGAIDSDKIPKWVAKLQDLIPYDAISSQTLCKIGDELALDFCPMCNESHVGNIVDDNRVYRQALDHFLPKSKYPIFSLSLYNLIPCCNTCNSLFKRNKDTLYPPHANPYIKGSDDYDIFDIEKLATAMLYNKISGSRVKFISTETEIDNNIRLFKLAGVYNKKATKAEIIRFISLSNRYYTEWRQCMNQDIFLTEILDYDHSKLPFTIKYGKFKKDLLKFMENAHR
ncbi:TPA: hypothetical protein R8G53_004228 [Citrobacter braakii]|uniref:hypothetical protein n=1 Tax=Citrobacter braakii TaxID=57706 RepID=UPI00295D99CE|nr:hypothetical protein [Citrobacter braakii]HEF0004080.1 hypothetical protein [Citrobacter braakii]HEF0034550.1 hypothetical protein [Citrobacter braakii]